MVKLTGFASLPADTFAAGPPAGEGISANGRTGPFPGQPVQGFSGVQFAPDDPGSFWFLSDNGFGAKSNSDDYLLRIYQLDPDFAGKEDGNGSVEVENFISLADPNGVIPFEIENEATAARLLTGADFDIESFVIADNGDIWVGDEFGPFLLHFDSEGTLLEAPISTPNIFELDTLNNQVPIVIGHRGASGEYPEHTLPGYLLALQQGSEFIETDYVMTKDGVSIARHEPLLDNTTDILERPEFSNRATTKTIDGVEYTGFFAEDFTLAEIKTLRAVQPRPERSDAFDELYEIPTMAEVVNLVQRYAAVTGKDVGIVHELKHNSYFDDIGLNLEEAVVDVLLETGFTDPSQNIIQTFEIEPLIRLENELLPEAGLENIPLHQLWGDLEEGSPSFSFAQDIVDNFSDPDFSEADARELYGELIDLVDLSADTGYGDLTSPEVLEWISSYAEGFNPWKNTILLRESIEESVDWDGNGIAEIDTQLTGEINPLIDWAHDAELVVNVYTLRNEERYLTLDEDGSVLTAPEETEALIRLGADGIITDFPLTSDRVRDAITAPVVRSPQNPAVLFDTLTGEAPIVIGHRGASGLRPEHTLEAYELAIALGADFIEPDLVTTKDGVLIARHENALATVELDEAGNIVFDAEGNPIVTQETTNVAELEQFSDRLTVKEIDGEAIGGWFSEDFTLAEIKELRARERIPGIRPENTQFNDQFEIPTLEEVIHLVKEVETQTGQKIGIYPETKHPTFFAKEGTFLDGTPIDISLSQTLIDTLVENEFTDPDRVFIQSFEIENLLNLQNEIMPEAGVDIPLVQLLGDLDEQFINEGGGGFSVPYDVVYNFSEAVEADSNVYEPFPIEISAETDYGDLVPPDVLEFIGDSYAEGIGPWKNSFLLREDLETPVDANGDGEAEITTGLTGEIFPLIEQAHDAELLVHPYTLRAEETFLTLESNGTPLTLTEEVALLIELGADGFFTDFPGRADFVRDLFVIEPNIPSSGGFEGMAFSPDRTTLYPLLEKAVKGDPDNARRIYEFDVASGKYTGLVGFYGTEDPSYAIGDFTPINEDEFLVIERDGGQADEAEFKKIFKIDFAEVDEDGFVAKEEVVDLLDIEDPNDLNNDGSETFEFPFVTIEDVLVIDEDTILVANDNNYPFSVGRPPEIDNNEIILLDLAKPLDLDPRLGGTVVTPVEDTSDSDLIFGTTDDDVVEIGSTPEFDGNNSLVFAGAGDDLIDASAGEGDNRIYAGKGDDEVFAGTNDRVFGGKGNDILDASLGGGANRLYGGEGDDLFFLGTDDALFGGEGDDQFFVISGGGNTLSGGEGADGFWIATGELPEEVNRITDFEVGRDILGIGGLGLSFADLSLTEEGNNLLVSTAGGDLAILQGISNLTESSLVFA